MFPFQQLLHIHIPLRHVVSLLYSIVNFFPSFLLSITSNSFTNVIVNCIPKLSPIFPFPDPIKLDEALIVTYSQFPKLASYTGIPCFILCYFTGLHRCGTFYILKARPSTSKMITTHFTAVVGNQTCSISRVCL